MLDIKFIRDNRELIKEGAKKKHVKADIDLLLKIDDERKSLMAKVEKIRSEQNLMNVKVAAAGDKNLKDQIISEMRILKDDLQTSEKKLSDIMANWQKLMISVPNIPDMSVPEGEGPSDNKEIKTEGEIKNFSFKPKSHIELMEGLDISDLERGVKVSGFRGYFLKNDAFLLSFALIQFAIDKILSLDKNYSPLMAPVLNNRELLVGTGYIPQGEDDLYKTQDGQYLSGTSEVSVMGYFSDEIISKKKLPIKFLAFSPCFRREAGSYGKETKGLIRVHEFYKLEQVILCEARHEESIKFHEELLTNAEGIMKDLGIPYRVVINAGGDLGLGQVKKYDIEAWLPSKKSYVETHSASYFHDFQTRRLNIRYRDDDGKNKFVHSLNSTAIALPRLLVPLVENYQNEDGSIAIPEVLRKYLNSRSSILGK